MFDQNLDDKAHAEFHACLITSMQHDHSPIKLVDGDGIPTRQPLMRAVVMWAIAIMPTRELQRCIMSAYVLTDEISNESIFNCFDDKSGIDECYRRHVSGF